MSLSKKAEKAKELAKKGSLSKMSDAMFKILNAAIYNEFMAAKDKDTIKAMSAYADMNENERKLFLEQVTS